MSCTFVVKGVAILGRSPFSVTTPSVFLDEEVDTFRLLSEASDVINTESGDRIRMETDGVPFSHTVLTEDTSVVTQVGGRPAETTHVRYRISSSELPDTTITFEYNAGSYTLGSSGDWRAYWSWGGANSNTGTATLFVLGGTEITNIAFYIQALNSSGQVIGTSATVNGTLDINT